MERKFADKRERMYEINKFIAKCSSVCMIIQVAAVFFARGKALTTSWVPAYAFLVFCILSIALQLGMSHSRQIAYEKVRLFIMASFLISFVWCDIFSANLFIPYIVYMPIMCMTLYEKKRLCSRNSFRGYPFWNSY